MGAVTDWYKVGKQRQIAFNSGLCLFYGVCTTQDSGPANKQDVRTMRYRPRDGKQGHTLKRLIPWSVGLFGISAGAIYLGLQARSFAGMLAGLAIGLIAIAVVLPPLRNTVTLLASLILTLSLAELALGHLLPAPESAMTSMDPTKDLVKQYGRYWQDTDLGRLPRPGQHRKRKLAPDGSEIYAVTYSIGSDGFRVTPGNPSGGAKRVNFLGCSYTFGDGLADDQTLPAQVQKILPDVTVRNFGMSGNGMHQALALMQSTRDISGQINIAVTVPWHAERSACVPSYSLASARYTLQADGSVQRDGFCGGISSYPLARLVSLSRVYEMVRTAIQTSTGQDAQIELYLGLLREMARLSASRQQVLKIAFFKADPEWFTGTYTNQKVLNAIVAMNLSVIDFTLTDKAQYKDLKLTLHPLDSHPSALANEIRAMLVSESLAK